MKEFLAPTLSQTIGTLRILWFENSNQYIIIAESLYSLIKAFLESKNKEQFIKKSVIDLGYENNSASQFFKEIDQLLEDCNTIKPDMVVPTILFKNTFSQICNIYKIGDLAIEVNYESEHIKSLVHPQIAHLSKKGHKIKPDHVFHLHQKNDKFYLFKDKTLIGEWALTDYHLLQGKFAIHLLCTLHNNEELDWMGTFHASTVLKKDEAIMLIGDSGKGKSTFTALLLANGYEILADDITPILAADNFVYPHPGAISIKSGAFDVLNSKLDNFDNLREHYINQYKGYVKYVSAPKSQGYLKGYPCKTMVKINYEKDAKTRLENISVADALNILIPESWVAAKRFNSQQFLNWIKDVQFYELTYSDSKEAIDLFSNL